jgi:hypothetical protein
MVRSVVLFVRVTDEMKSALERAAQEEDLKVAQLLRRIIRDWLERHPPPPELDDPLTTP